MSLDHQDLDDLVNLATDIGTAHKQATEHPDVITQQESQDLDQFHEEAKQTAQDLDPQSVAADGAELPDPPEITADSVWSFLGSCGINLILPFINGVMLGFGEILAHEIGFRYNWSGAKLDYKSEKSRYILKYLAIQVVLSVIRALISLKVAALDGYLVSSLITKRFKSFFKYLVFWVLIGVPASLTEAFFVKTRQLLSQSVRMNMTDEVLDSYLPDNGNSTVYHLINKSKNESDRNTIDDPNQRITTVIEQFSDSLSAIPSQILVPILDIALAANQLSKTGEHVAEGGILLGLITTVSTLVLKVFTPNFSKFSALSNSLENKFHAYHSRIVNNNEEIALAKGHRREIDLLDMNYFELERFKRMELRRMAVYDFAVSFVFKYCLGAFGLLLCSLPIFTTAYQHNFYISDHASSRISADFVTNRRLLLTASDALGSLVRAKKNIQNLFGYSESIREFEQALTEINNSLDKDSAVETATNVRPLVKGPNVSYGDEISFQNVPLVTPTGTVLVQDLTFTIKSGDNLLIIGPNGCGKSSLFRILGGLWDVQAPGHLVIPSSKEDIFYLPQKSYLTYGSLREQIVYPHTVEEYKQKLQKANMDGTVKKDDSYLIGLLKMVKLEHLLEMASEKDDEDEDEMSHALETPLEIEKRWPDLLSVGEQQRLALARMYYHQPRFAVLDECTSSISPDLEQECYRLAIEEFGITVLSVCHRTSLWKFHSHILKFGTPGMVQSDSESHDSEGELSRASPLHDTPNTTTFTKFDPLKRLERHEELLRVEARLKNSSNIQKRLRALENRKNRSNKLIPALLHEDHGNLCRQRAGERDLLHSLKILSSDTFVLGVAPRNKDWQENTDLIRSIVKEIRIYHLNCLVAHVLNQWGTLWNLQNPSIDLVEPKQCKHSVESDGRVLASSHLARKFLEPKNLLECSVNDLGRNAAAWFQFLPHVCLLDQLDGLFVKRKILDIETKEVVHVAARLVQHQRFRIRRCLKLVVYVSGKVTVVLWNILLVSKLFILLSRRLNRRRQIG
ncbi:hypothetical protein OGAPHI_004355 [Ogataea philodendri]|uniref:ABC transporter domain-containing protein n=1 Tax=Ogataea philodendri TaxID=1378263 RepID=A0A9P8T4W3_9ASCO|nr:uncharacterized protein OGAPHI_004355 [Ogataea philodendri]KAH3666166.1 hypothetical protein OGAPHI_004355 [Ogataea philodendri]